MKRISPFALLMIASVFILGCSIQDEQLGLNEDVVLNRSNTLASEMQRSQAGNENEVVTVKSGTIHRLFFDKEFKIWSDPKPYPGTEINLVFSGSENFVHLGKTTVVIKVKIVNTIPFNMTATAKVSIIAANGDELQFMYDLSIDRSDPPEYIFTGTASVSSGTGRFKNAEGSLEYNGRMNWESAIGSATFTGEIDY